MSMDVSLGTSGKYSYAFVKVMFDGRIQLVMSNETESYDSIVDYQLEGVDIEDEWRYAVREGNTELGLEDYKADYTEYFEPNLEDYEHCEDDDYYYDINSGDYEIVSNENLLDCIVDIEDHYEATLSEDDKQKIETVFNCALEKKKEYEERTKQAEEDKRRRNGYKVYTHI